MKLHPVAAALLATMLLPGCGLVMVNNPAHTGLDCTRSRWWPATDAVVAVAGTTLLISQGVARDQPMSLVAPGLLVASALWGNTKVSRCARLWREASPEQIAAFHADAAHRRARQDAEAQAEREQFVADQLRFAEELGAEPPLSVQPARGDNVAASPELDPDPADPADSREAPAPGPAATRGASGAWTTRSRVECAAYDWATTTTAQGLDRARHVQAMTDVCTRCVDAHKQFVLEWRPGVATRCE